MLPIGLMGVGHDRELLVMVGDHRGRLATLHWNHTTRLTTQQTDDTGNELIKFMCSLSLLCATKLKITLIVFRVYDEVGSSPQPEDTPYEERLQSVVVSPHRARRHRRDSSPDDRKHSKVSKKTLSERYETVFFFFHFKSNVFRL